MIYLKKIIAILCALLLNNFSYSSAKISPLNPYEFKVAAEYALPAKSSRSPLRAPQSSRVTLLSTGSSAHAPHTARSARPALGVVDEHEIKPPQPPIRRLAVPASALVVPSESTVRAQVQTAAGVKHEHEISNKRENEFNERLKRAMDVAVHRYLVNLNEIINNIEDGRSMLILKRSGDDAYTVTYNFDQSLNPYFKKDFEKLVGLSFAYMKDEIAEHLANVLNEKIETSEKQLQAFAKTYLQGTRYAEEDIGLGIAMQNLRETVERIWSPTWSDKFAYYLSCCNCCKPCHYKE